MRVPGGTIFIRDACRRACRQAEVAESLHGAGAASRPKPVAAVLAAGRGAGNKKVPVSSPSYRSRRAWNRIWDSRLALFKAALQNGGFVG